MDNDDTPSPPEEKPPSERLKLVSENKPEEVKRNRETGMTRYSLDNAIATLAANLLRVLAGAGQRHQIIYDILKCHEALIEHVQACGGPDGPGAFPNFEDVLPFLFSDDIIEDDDAWDNGTRQKNSARRRMKQAALREAAARLLHQDVQVRRNNSEFDRGLSSYESGLEQARKFYQEMNTPKGRVRRETQRTEERIKHIGVKPVKTVSMWDALEEQQKRKNDDEG